MIRHKVWLIEKLQKIGCQCHVGQEVWVVWEEKLFWSDGSSLVLFHSLDLEDTQKLTLLHDLLLGQGRRFSQP